MFLSFEVMLYTLLRDKNWRVYMVSLGDALIRYSGVHFTAVNCTIRGQFPP